MLHQNLWCYTPAMPTTRPRHTLTETDELAAALRVAGEHWPAQRDDRAALLRALVVRGAESLEREDQGQRDERERRVRSAAGAATGSFPAGAAAALRDEWPA